MDAIMLDGQIFAFHDDAVKIAHERVILVQADHCRLAQMGQQIDLAMRRDDLHGDRKRPAQRLAGVDPADAHLLLAEINRKFRLAIVHRALPLPAKARSPVQSTWGVVSPVLPCNICYGELSCLEC